MLWRRAATVGLTAFALLLAAQPAGAVTYVGLHDLTCEGATTEGTGMPTDTRLDVALVDPASDRTMTRGQVTTRATGTFGLRRRGDDTSSPRSRRSRSACWGVVYGSTPVSIW